VKKKDFWLLSMMSEGMAQNDIHIDRSVVITQRATRISSVSGVRDAARESHETHRALVQFVNVGRHVVVIVAAGVERVRASVTAVKVWTVAILSLCACGSGRGPRRCAAIGLKPADT